MSERKVIGRKGEDIATAYIKELGYEILERNWRYNRAEIDIIGKDQYGLVFIEVRARSSSNFGQPEETISDYKQQLIFSAAQRYMEKIDYDWEIRFDIIAILFHENVEFKNYDLKHIKDVYH